MSQYTDLLDILSARQDGEPGVEIGTVRSTEPLTLYVGGAVITRNIQGPPFLIRPWPEEIPLSEEMAAYLETLRLAPGDTVTVHRQNENNIILSKVVKT